MKKTKVTLYGTHAEICHIIAKCESYGWKFKVSVNSPITIHLPIDQIYRLYYVGRQSVL